MSAPLFRKLYIFVLFMWTYDVVKLSLLMWLKTFMETIVQFFNDNLFLPPTRKWNCRHSNYMLQKYRQVFDLQICELNNFSVRIYSLCATWNLSESEIYRYLLHFHWIDWIFCMVEKRNYLFTDFWKAYSSSMHYYIYFFFQLEIYYSVSFIIPL